MTGLGFKQRPRAGQAKFFADVLRIPKYFHYEEYHETTDSALPCVCVLTSDRDAEWVWLKIMPSPKWMV